MPRQLPIRALCLAVLAISSISSHALENNGPVLPFGVLDFGAGMLPPVTDIGTIGFRAASFNAGVAKDASGHDSAVHTHMHVNSYGLAFIEMTHAMLWGGSVGWAAVMPVLDMHLHLGIPSASGYQPLEGRDAAQGDLELTPVILAWHPSPALFTSAGISVQLPTGAYDKSRLVSVGVNHWSVSPNISFTHVGESGFEVSSNIQLNVHGVNHATRYRSGSEYQHEFALGQHVGAFTVGLGGYYIRQLTDDRQDGVDVGNRSRVLALGPAVQYFVPGGRWPLVQLHAYQEIMARNRNQGSQVAAKLSWSF